MDLEKLSQLSRIELTADEKEKFGKDLESILGYISEIKDAHADLPKSEEIVPELRNVVREDEDAYESGVFTKEIVEEMPRSKSNYLVVKQIIEK